MSRLAEIYKSEKTKGGGLVSALGKRTLEKIDPRQMFNQKGLAAAIAPSLFKTYSATRSGGKSPASLSTLTPQISTQNMESKIDILSSEMRVVGNNTRVAAKNSMSLPDMARDMNVMRQNIIKLVKLQGGEATNKADMFFKKSSENEAAYETQFSKQKGVTTPTQAKDSEKKGDGGLLGTLATIGLTAFNLLKDTIGKIVGAFGSLISIIPGVTTLLSGLKTAFSVLEGALGLLASPAGVIFGLMASMGLAIKYFQDKLLDKERELGGEKGAEMMSEQLGDMAAGAGDAMGGGTSFVTGTDVTGKKLGTPEDILQNRKDFTEQQKRQQGADTLKRLNVSPSSAGGGRGGQGGPTAQQLSPTPVPSSEDGMDSGKKQILDFIASKESAGAGYNALVYGKPGVPKAAPLTDMSIQEVFDYQKTMIPNGHASTAVGRYQFINATLRDLVSKAKIPLSEKFTPETQDKLAGMLLDQAGYDNFKSGRISQDTFQNKVAGIWASLPKVDGTSDYAGIAGNKVGATSAAFQTVLASASQIPPRPTTGNALTSASVQVASAGQAGGTTVINNNTTNNTKTAGGQGSQGTPNIPSAFDDVFNTLFGRVT